MELSSLSGSIFSGCHLLPSGELTWFDNSICYSYLMMEKR